MASNPPLLYITGASSGIGQALALRFHQAGYRLALAARRTEEVKTWATAQGISADSYEIYSADVAVTDSIVAAGQACLARQGVPDVVIANAGIILLRQHTQLFMAEQIRQSQAGRLQALQLLPSGIALYALDEDLAARGLTAPERVQALSGAIAECVGSMGALVEGLLELSRLDARSLTPRPTAFVLQGLFDPRVTDSVFLSLNASPWVEAYVANDYALKKLSSYLLMPQMSLAQVLISFQEAFLGS